MIPFPGKAFTGADFSFIRIIFPEFRIIYSINWKLQCGPSCVESDYYVCRVEFSSDFICAT